MYLNLHRKPYEAADRELIGMAHAAEALALVRACPAYRPTTLLAAPGLARELGVGAVEIKCEQSRMGLGSFKALGGAYAVARLILEHAGVASGDLASPAVRAVAASMTFVCASAGNHGLSVAAGARVFGARAVVVLAEGVPESFARRLADLGATVVRAGDTYEASVAHAIAESARQGWALVADSSWPGYLDIPLTVMRGYCVLLDEAARELEATGGPATHIFVQAGVGGLAAPTAAYLRDRWGEAIRVVVVEPAGAPCLLESVRQGAPGPIAGGPTRLGRLDCREPSLLAFQLLSGLADAFLLISDAEAEAAAARLIPEGAALSPCGAAGAAGLIQAARDPATREALGLGTHARVLLIGTEVPQP